MNRAITWPELDVFVELVAAFFASKGRDPTDAEMDELVDEAKSLAAAGTGSHEVH